MRKSKYTTANFISRVKEIYKELYDYSKTVYRGAQINVIIICKIHGDFEKTPNAHLCGRGCPKCGIIRSTKSRTFSLSEVIDRFTQVHDNIYDYSNFVYVNNNTKGIIICKKHGEFKQSFKKHCLGQGCSKCGKASHWRREDYVKKVNGKICTFYVIRCFNEHENFYKIGLTMNSTEERYKGAIKMPYAYEIISEIYGEAGFIWDLELTEKIKLKEYHYKPKLDFKGSKTECFTNYKPEGCQTKILNT